MTRHKNQSELGKLTRDYDERMLTLMRQLPLSGVIETADHKVNKSQVLILNQLLELVKN